MIDKIVFTDTDRSSLTVYYKDGTMGGCSWPPGSEHDIEMVEKYGGQYEIERSTIDYERDQLKKYDMWDRFESGYVKYLDSFSIDAIVSEDVDASDMMKIKMTMFKKDLVRECKDRELLAGLRKAKDIVDLMMYYGMIRDAANRSV